MHSDETKKKLSDWRKNYYKTGGKHPMKGKKHSLISREKMSQSQLGEKHSQWKGGRIKTKSGYIWVRIPEHPNASKVSPKGYVLEHRLVMEKKIGRYLVKGDVVHHINGIRDDNRPSNLFLTTSSKHVADHNKKRVWTEESKNKHRIKASKLKRNNKGQFTGY